MIRWTPIAVDEPSFFKGKTPALPLYSATVVGRSAVLRIFGGGFAGLAISLTTIPFDSCEEATAWIETNKLEAAPAAD